MTPVRIENLVKRYGDVYALHDVSVEIAGGELFFLLGPSGCGKTTLLRSIAGFVIPDSGRIHLGEVDITNVPPNKRNTAMVFQNYALWPHMTVEENVGFGLDVQGVSSKDRRRQVLEGLALVQMEDLAARKPNQLSGGQQQRVALARALVVRPRCLLLDEPLSNLDAKLRLHMRRVIRKLCKQLNQTTIYVTHDQKEALSMADRVAVLRDGKIVQVGTPLELYNQPVSPFVAEFVGETNFVPATVTRCEGNLCTLATAAGVIRGVSVAAQGPAAGTVVAVSIRPESLRFINNKNDGGPNEKAGSSASVNRLQGAMVEAMYLGEVAQYEVRIAGDIVLKVMQQNPRAEPPPAGQKVTLEFDAAEAVVLRE